MEETLFKFCCVYTNNASITQEMRFLHINNGFILESCHICMESLIICLHRNVNNSKFIKKIPPWNFSSTPPPPNVARVIAALILAVCDGACMYMFIMLYFLVCTVCVSEPDRSTLNVLNYKYKYFTPGMYLSTSTFLFGEMYLSTFRVLSKCT